MNLVIPKPEIPPDIAQNYKQVMIPSNRKSGELKVLSDPGESAVDRATGCGPATENGADQKGD